MTVNQAIDGKTSQPGLNVMIGPEGHSKTAALNLSSRRFDSHQIWLKK